MYAPAVKQEDKKLDPAAAAVQVAAAPLAAEHVPSIIEK